MYGLKDTPTKCLISTFSSEDFFSVHTQNLQNSESQKMLYIYITINFILSLHFNVFILFYFLNVTS